MDRLSYFVKQFSFDDWANREVLASMKRADPLTSRSLKLMAHILGAEWLWYNRILEQESSIPVWPEWSLEKCEIELDNLKREWQSFIDRLNIDRLLDSILYINSKGETWRSNLEDILTHIIMHSVHHRAQIAADMRSNGSTPAYTDYIHAVREGFIK